MYVFTYPICILHENNFSNQTRTRIRTHTHNRTHHTHAYTNADQYVCMYVTQLRSMLCPCAQARQHDRSAATMRAHARALHSVALYDCVCVLYACLIFSIYSIYIVCTCVNLISSKQVVLKRAVYWPLQHI